MSDILPKHVEAHLQEHTNGGYLVLRINNDGDVIYDCDFDNEISFYSIISKGEMVCRSILNASQQSIDQSMMDDPANGDESEEDEDY